MSKASRVPAVAIVAVGAFLALSPGAVAQVTVGQVAPSNPEAFCGDSESWDELQTAVAAGPSYAVPAPGGVITSWSTSAGPGLGQKYEMKVYRQTGLGSYTVVAHDGPRPLTPSVLNTFPVSIPVQAGDIVGIHIPTELESSKTACQFGTGNPLDRGGWREGDHADGTSFTLEGEEGGFRYNVSATVLPPPTLSALTPASGSVKGGTSVVIAGANLASVQGVTFGTTAATSFTVNSEAQITAISPASTMLNQVPVTVTTAAGSVSSPTTFAYEGCNVPKLGGKKLKAAKKSLKKNDCKLGKVKKTGHVTTKNGKVIKQSPKSGTILAPGAKVAVKLG